MPSEARQKKIMEKLNRAQKCSILGPQNLGSRGARAPEAPPDPHLHNVFMLFNYFKYVTYVNFILNMQGHVLFLEWKPCCQSYLSLPLLISETIIAI